MVEIYDHVRPIDADYPDGIYRVVGTGEPVALLRVGDDAGRRVVTGEVVTVDSEELAGFESAENPEGNRSLGAMLTGIPKTIYWQLRAFATSLAANPIPAAVGVALVVVGELGQRMGEIPETASVALILGGALVLAAVGSGRL